MFPIPIRRFRFHRLSHFMATYGAFIFLIGLLHGQNSVPDWKWTEARDLGMDGQGWDNTAAPYDRLPAAAQSTVRSAVWNLSRHSAGLSVRFITDAPSLKVSWKLTSANLAMNHMPATGVSGLDLYVKTESGWRWLAVGIPQQKENTQTLFADLPATPREYQLYLPLYNGIEILQIGVPADSTLQPAPPRTAHHRPILFYGTSITQGGCASRPGMVHTALLERWLDTPIINLGFSGNGKMEPELAHLIAQLSPSIIVLDCLPNLNAEEVASRTPPFLDILREASACIPIVLVEDRSYSNSFLLQSKEQHNAANRKALRTVYQTRKEQGDLHLFYIEGETLLGEDGEATVDSSHPTDLGFVRQAEVFATVLKPLLE